MGERRWGNYSSCCRLCLSEKMGSLKPIFEDSSKGEEVVLNIRTFVDVDITVDDRLSTMICTQCLSTLKSWQAFKKTCSENQNKLIGWMNTWNSNNLADIGIQVKDEVVDDEGNTTPVVIDDDSQNVERVTVKSEIVHNTYESPPVEEDIYDLPPPLTPHPPGEELPNNMSTDDEGDENNEDREDTKLKPAPASSKMTNDGRICEICDKVFSTSSNRRKHEVMIHNKKDNVNVKAPERSTDLNKSKEMEDMQSKPRTPKTVSRTRSQSEAEIKKIEFAAGLKLQQRSRNSNQIPVENMPLTKVEISYLEKYKCLAKMGYTKTCVCHNDSFCDSKDLLAHLRKYRIWCSMNTCYSCLIVFPNRTPYLRHGPNCQKEFFQNVKRLAESPVNPEIKMRLYQNFKCVKCNCVFTFHEDFYSHFDQDHMESTQTTPSITCHCSKIFNDMEEYKNHLHISCFLRYFCDVCFVTFASTDAFKVHCEKEHDLKEGDSIESYDFFHKSNYLLDKEVSFVNQKKRSLPLDAKDNDNRKVKRRTVNLPIDASAPHLEVENENYAPNPQKVINPVHLSKSRQPTGCPACTKVYSSLHNMLRHYKTAHDNGGKILPCLKCSIKFRTVNELRQHDKNVHALEMYKFSCPDCGNLFKSLEEWTKHTQKHPKKSCSECGKQFTLQSELDQHRSVHLNIKVYRDSKTQHYKSTMVRPGTNFLCQICDKNFNSKTELKQHRVLHGKMPILDVHDADDVDEKKIVLNTKYSCQECNKHYLTYSGIWDHNKKHHPELTAVANNEFPQPCTSCSKILTTRSALVNHQRIHERLNSKKVNEQNGNTWRTTTKTKTSKCSSPDSESYYTCKKCFKVFSSRSNLRSHMRCHGIHLNPSRSSTKTGKVIKTYWCDICHQACPGYAELQQHKQEHIKKRPLPELSAQVTLTEPKKPIQFECDLCNQKFPTNFILKRHRDKHINQSKMIIYCKYCKIPFNGPLELNKHMLNEHDESSKAAAKQKQPANTDGSKKYPCKVCKKVFDHAGALASHQGWHKRGKVDQKFRSQGKLLRTMVIPEASISNTTNDKHQCYSCSKKFPSDTLLQIHILERHRNINTTVLNCDTCKVNFETRSAFDNHMKLHKSSAADNQVSPGKPHPCKYCPAGFSRSDTLNAHVRQHHKEFYNDTYKCDICDRVFDKRNSLSIHIKVHEKNKTNNISPSATSTTTGSNNTPKSVQNKSVYFCSICDLGFALAKDLRSHVLSAHPF